MLQEPTHRQENIPEENTRGFFHIPQCCLTASGRHAESSSFIYSTYYPTAFPCHANCSSGRRLEEKDERRKERGGDCETMSDIQCQAKFWKHLIECMFLIILKTFSSKGLELNTCKTKIFFLWQLVSATE